MRSSKQLHQLDSHTTLLLLYLLHTKHSLGIYFTFSKKLVAMINVNVFGKIVEKTKTTTTKKKTFEKSAN